LAHLAARFNALHHGWAGGLGHEAREFALAHLAGGGAGLIAAVVWAGLGRPDALIEWAVLLWLTSPLFLAAGALAGWPIRWLQAASAANAILLLTGLAALSGGLSSLFLPWLVLVPAEAALTRRPLVLALAMVAGAAAIAGLAVLGLAGLLPAFDLPANWQSLSMAASLGGCLLYAGLLAVNVRRVHARAAERIAESEASYRFLADNAADLILRLSAAGEVLYASPAAQAVIGVPAVALFAKPLRDLVHSGDVKEAQRALVRAGYFGEEATIECRLAAGDGEPVWVELHCRPVRRPDAPRRKPLFGFLRRHAKGAARPGMEIIAIARDITRRHEHEEALKRAYSLAEAHSKAKSRFLANMSHEIRTPLNSILGFSQMIGAEMFGPIGHPRYLEYAGLIGESGNYLLELINDILDMAKIEAGKYVLSTEPLNLAATLERTLRVMMPQFREKGVKLEVDVAASLPEITADARAVRQMLFNLLSNALKFTPEGGRAKVRLCAEAGSMLIEVSDTGIGIAEKDLQRLARPFEQADDAHVRSQTGTGLGLALVKSLTHLHGGTLAIKSAPGRGTHIAIRLPLSGAATSGKPSAQIAAAA
jgi:cell cycle sensor histidine kinase DivJ